MPLDLNDDKTLRTINAGMKEAVDSYYIKNNDYPEGGNDHLLESAIKELLDDNVHEDFIKDQVKTAVLASNVLYQQIMKDVLDINEANLQFDEENNDNHSDSDEHSLHEDMFEEDLNAILELVDEYILDELLLKYYDNNPHPNNNRKRLRHRG